MNERDSEIMSQSLSMHGYVEGMDLESADLVILNTCSIRAKAEQKVMSLLGMLRKVKLAKPDMQICVAGCVAQQEGEHLLERMPHVDLVVGTQNIYNIGELLDLARTRPGYVAVAMQENYDIPRLMPARNEKISERLQAGDDVKLSKSAVFRKFVTIMQGCNNYCAYCVVPYTRGREISRKVNDIIEEVKVLVESGVKEITLLGQNVNSYGKTNIVTENGLPCSFADLLHKVAETEGLARLRFTTSNPKDLSDELMRSFRDIPSLCPQFHLPVQAGSDAVLKRMNRKYSVAQYLDLVDRLREYCPEIALSTDIIVGFPGETEEDFQGTMDLLDKVRYHGSFSFKYSDRPGTRASDFSDKVTEEVKTARLMRFQSRQDEISLERNREYIGRVKDIMVEDVGPESLKGRTDTNHIVHLHEHVVAKPGDFIDVEIYHAGQHSLKGKIV
ncbi:tRNA-i(6)A37 thiotransferase enzyme MiaB [Desulfopila aestuarii DSM 18488]|uniref:tRNA-2-methylthio-N(6)-dimethylallyladenosine synthase n=2 Tax=Desulfopila aestuarii TaxID=231440 RepID=A0A1M7Y131_9BACT|nr:tRNA-i(6)A37 thiotransferase enzyme MiaB [Desulfopila aestuarii DSM 18488]